MRIAFVTPEFPTEYRNGGGLASYLDRVCRVLIEQGHQPEVFVVSDTDQRFDDSGVLVHRVDPSRWKSKSDWVERVAGWLPKGSYAIKCSGRILATAAAMASAFKKREREVEFDFVQSSDFQAIGFMLPRKRTRPHVVRCSCAADLWSAADGEHGFNVWQCYWERRAMMRADRVYAPSALVSDHYKSKHNIDVSVVRPPLCNMPSAGDLPADLGDVGRFHFHFGQLRRRKGTDFLAAALPLVWRKVPEYRMIWAGGSSEAYLQAFRELWGEHADKITYVGAVPRGSVYALLNRCEASVLPSMVDNLPNTVIESLLFDRPVVGTRRSSIDEIVDGKQNGWLVDFGDTQQLADAMIEAWSGGVKPGKDLFSVSPIWAEMQPDTAVKNLVRFAVQSSEVSVASH